MNAHMIHFVKRRITAVIPLLIYGIFYLLYFSILEHVDFRYYYVPYCTLDSQIPFISYFIIPYFLWFAFVPLVVAIVLFTDLKLYRRVSVMLMIGMSVFLLVSTFFPTKLYLRPEITAHNIFDQAVKFLYSSDTPTNVFPSIHVYNTCVVLWSVWKSRSRLLCNAVSRLVSTILSVLIILATVFLKQHSVIDVIGAFVMFGAVLGVYALVSGARNRKRSYADEKTGYAKRSRFQRQ